MTHARTLSRHLGAAGLVAGFLVAVPSLAAPSAEIRNVSAVGSSATHINTSVSAAYRFSANDPKFYHKLSVAVSRPTLRVGALAALSAGKLLPGLGLAITAAGFVLSNNNEIMVPDSEFSSLQQEMLLQHDLVPEPYKSGGPYVFSGGLSACNGNNVVFANHASHVACLRTKGTQSWVDREIVTVEATRYLVYSPSYGYNTWITYYPSTGSVTEPDYVNGESELSPATQSDLEQLDLYLPNSIVPDIWQRDVSDYPQEWADTNAAADLMPGIDAAGQAAPEAHQAVSDWAENMTAQMNGDPLPNPETDVGGNSASDEIVEQWDEEPPDFPLEPVPAWNVEVIDELPDYDPGLSGGTCPAPTVIDIPLYGVVTIEWTPICDFAAMIAGAVKALGLLMGLFIVLGRK